MYIPKTMKQKMSDVFYDKTISVLDNEIIVDAEGGVTYKGITGINASSGNNSNIIDTFNGNVSFSNCKKIQEEYGLSYDINIAITTSTDVNISINDIIKYNDVIYNVTDVLPSDSHILIVAVKWQQ